MAVSFISILGSNNSILGETRGQYINAEYAVAHLVEAVRYKPGGRDFDSPWGHCLYPSDCTQPLIN